MSLASKIAVFLIRFYQAAISPVLGGGKCRFYPTCSEYAAEAFRKHGFFYGVWLSVRRFSRCGPWNPDGYDPVPERDEVAGKRIQH